MRLALFQPEIPQNTGTLMRLGACLGVPLDVIEPCGFIWNDQKLRRAGMDYIELANVERHVSWSKFYEAKRLSSARIVLLDAKAEESFVSFRFRPDDILLLGQESLGVPQEVAKMVQAQIVIPMRPDCRSLNVAVSAAMVLSEALRQTNQFPKGGL